MRSIVVNQGLLLHVSGVFVEVLVAIRVHAEKANVVRMLAEAFVIRLESSYR